ncbi:MAG: proton-conducting transporter membrane subunit, partial [Desulfoferrobacter sp.]
LLAAGLTMITGILGALVQNDLRRILSFNLVSHVGYMIMGLGLYTPLALAGSIFYTVQDIIVKTSLFLVSGAVYRLRGTYRLNRLGGLYSTNPGLAVLFLLPALSLAGMPPFSGFWGKFILVKAGLDVNSYLIVAAALIVGLLTLYSMSTVWSEVFWKKQPEEQNEPALESLPSGSWLLYVVPVAILVALMTLIGLWPGPFFDFAHQAAEQLVNPSDYIQAVLGKSA